MKPKIPTRLGPGRPKAAEPLTPVTTYLPVQTHDRLIKMANDKGADVSAVIRRIIILNIFPTGKSG